MDMNLSGKLTVEQIDLRNWPKIRVVGTTDFGSDNYRIELPVIDLTDLYVETESEYLTIRGGFGSRSDTFRVSLTGKVTFPLGLDESGAMFSITKLEKEVEKDESK